MTGARASGGATDVDLGVLDGPLLVFGGPYGNRQATAALFAEAARRGIAPGHIICTGDLTAYCADPGAVVEAVRAAGIHVVMGNCEESLAAESTDCGCGFAEGSECARLSQRWHAYNGAALDAAVKAWMGALPRILRFTLNGRRLAVIHAAAGDIGRFVFASTPAAEKAADLDFLRVDGIVAGHSGLPFTQVVGGRLWHNAGVIGMPANDGTSRTWYSMLAADGDGIAVTHHPLRYDHAAAATRMRAAGLPAAYARTLSDGLWPNMDVLPAAERALVGMALAPPALRWPGPRRSAAA